MYYVYSYLFDDAAYNEITKSYLVQPRVLHAPNLDAFLQDAVLTMSMNKSGTFTFTIPPDSPYAENIAVMRSFLTVYTDKPKSTFLWAGRPISVETDLYGNRTYTVEGLLSILNDVYFAPYKFGGGHLDEFMNKMLKALKWYKEFGFDVGFDPKLPQDEPGKTYVFPDYAPPDCVELATFPEMAENDFSQSLLYVNRYIENGDNGTTEEKRTLTRWWSSYETIMDILQTRVIDYFGGFLEIDAVKSGALRDGFFRLRYLDPETEENRLNQTIEIGKNVLEISSSYTAEDFYTTFIPVEIGEDGEETTLENKEDIGTAATNCFWTYYYGGADGILYPGNYVMWRNNHTQANFDKTFPTNLVVNHGLYQKYGMICKKIEFSFEDDATYETKKNTVVDFAMKMKAPQATFTVRAVDLSMVESGVDCFRVGRQVKVLCPSLGVEEWMTIEELCIRLDDPTNCTVTLNGTLESISKLVAGR